MGGEPHIVRSRNHHPRHRAPLETAHPVGQNFRRHPTQELETLRQQSESGGRGLIPGETDKPDPGPGQDSTKHFDTSAFDRPPVDHQHLPRSPHPRTTLISVLRPPRLLLRSHQTTEVPIRPLIPRRLRLHQQPLRGHLPLRIRNPFRHQIPDHISVLSHRPTTSPLTIQLAGLPSQHLPFHRLRIHTTDLRGPPIRTDIPIHRNNIHRLPR